MTGEQIVGELGRIYPENEEYWEVVNSHFDEEEAGSFLDFEYDDISFCVRNAGDFDLFLQIIIKTQKDMSDVKIEACPLEQFKNGDINDKDWKRLHFSIVSEVKDDFLIVDM